MKNSVLPELEERVESKIQPAKRMWVAANPADGLFSDVLLEKSGVERRRRTFSTILSLALQLFFFGILLMIPLMFTEALPTHALVTMLMAPPPPPPPPPPPAVMPQVSAPKVSTNVIDGQLQAPSRIPKEIAIIKEDSAPAGAIGVVGGVEGGVPGGQVNGVMGGILNNKPIDLPKPVVAPKIVRVSQGVSEGMLVNKVMPEYPIVAKVAHVQGDVELKAIISTDGTIQKLQLVSGNPLLVATAMRAVQQWHYKPYLLNGVPVEVETNITVKFSLIQQ